MLSKVTAKNFQSWGLLEFKINQGIVLIDGWNEDDQRSEGSGKSAVLNAISWCVFGKIPKDANVDDVIKDGQDSCVVELEFDNGDKIIRSRKPNDIYIVKNGIKVKGKDAKETQVFIEEFIGCNFETFCQSVYFAQNYDKKFLSSNQEERGKILSSIQNLQIFDKARKEVMELLKLEEPKVVKLKAEVQVQQSTIINNDAQLKLVDTLIANKIDAHKRQLEAIVVQIQHAEKDLTNQMSTRFMVQTEFDAIDQAQLEVDQAELLALKSEYQTKLAEINLQVSQIDSVTKQLAAKEREGQALATKHKTIEDRLAAGLTSPKFDRLNADLAKAQQYQTQPEFIRLVTKHKALTAYLANPTKTCPTCGSELAHIDLSHSQAELAENKKAQAELATNSQAKVAEIEKSKQDLTAELEVERQNLTVELENIVTQLGLIAEYLDANPAPVLDDLNAAKAEVNAVLAETEKHLNAITTSKNRIGIMLSQLTMLDNQIKNAETKVASLNAELQSLAQPDLQTEYQKQQDLQKSSELSQVKVNELTDLVTATETKVAQYEALKDGFKEIKTYVFNNALSELNYRANEYLVQLFDTDASIKFTTEDQKIELQLTLNGNARSLGLLSGGQNRRFNLAVDLALADIVTYRKTSKLNILVMDEYFKDLSEISMEKSLDLLKSRKCPVILIEHNSIFKNIIDNTFFVKLENGTSYESR
jgi:exonuclease SbcC